jgi:1,2-diacylglycerol 3-alpha-glucosyltransferase
MRIAYFSDTFPPEINGVSVSVQHHAKVMKDHGHEVLVITTNPFSNIIDENEGMIRIPGIELKKLYGYRMSSFFSAKAYTLIKKWQPDLIHIHTDAGIGIFGKIMSVALNRPLVLTYHTMYEDYTHYAGIFRGLVNRVVKTFSKSLAEQCTEFIAPSAKTKDKIRSYGADRYINIVPTGIDFSRFKKANLSIEKYQEFEQKINPKHEKIFLSLGRLAKEKSVDHLLRGFAEYLKRPDHIAARLIIAGDGPERHHLETLAQSLHLDDHIHFVGAVPIQEVPYYYNLADLFLSASVTETQGLTFMEAMASSTVVLCRFDENLASLISDRKTGFFVDRPEEFAKAIATVMQLEPAALQKIIDQAHKAVDYYSLETFYENLIKVYIRALRQYW